jgi:hypothetical protein
MAHAKLNPLHLRLGGTPLPRPRFRLRRQTSEPSLKERSAFATMAGLTATLTGRKEDGSTVTSKDAPDVGKRAELTRENLLLHTSLVSVYMPRHKSRQ